jgi:hypothetical protein
MYWLRKLWKYLKVSKKDSILGELIPQQASILTLYPKILRDGCNENNLF